MRNGCVPQLPIRIPDFRQTFVNTNMACVGRDACHGHSQIASAGSGQRSANRARSRTGWPSWRFGKPAGEAQKHDQMTGRLGAGTLISLPSFSIVFILMVSDPPQLSLDAISFKREIFWTTVGKSFTLSP
jgi:hypothetical protein